MSDERRAKFKGKDCLARSADLKRGAQDARHKKSRERALDTKRVMLFESQEQPDRNRSMHALNLLKETISGAVQNEKQTIECLVSLFRCLSDPNSEVHGLLADGLIRVLEACLSINVDAIQIQAAKCITSIASGDHPQTSQLFPLIPTVLAQLQSAETSTDLKTQLCWAMGNIAVDCPLCKAQLVTCGVPQVVIQLLLGYTQAFHSYVQSHTQLQPTTPSQPPLLPTRIRANSKYASLTNTITNLLWTLTNIVRGTGDITYIHQLPDADIHAILSLYCCEDECVCSMVRWLFTILTSKDDGVFNRLVGMGLHGLCTQALCAYIPLDASGGGGGVGGSMSTDSTTTTAMYGIDRDEEGLLAVIRCMGNICAGSATCALTTYTQNLCVPRLIACLDGDMYSKFVGKEALRTLSYILHNTSLESQLVCVQPHVAGFLRHFHWVMHSEDSELQEAYLILLESVHPALTLRYYSSHAWEMKGDMQAMCKLVVNAKVTSMICQIAVLQIWLGWVYADVKLMSGLLSSLDALESIENLQYVTDEPRVCDVAQEIVTLVYKQLEEEGNEEIEAPDSLAPPSVHSFGITVGRGQGAVVPAWMQK